MKRIALLLSAVCLTATLTNANLLSNGNFNDPNSTAAPTDWLTWSYNGGWANHQDNTDGTIDGVDGTFYMACGGFDSAGGGVYQIVPGTAGLAYTLTVDSGAQAWWLPYGEMRIFFLDSGDNQLDQSIMPTVDPAVYGQNYDIPHPWMNYTLTAVAPANTAQVKVEFAEPNGTGTVWFDNAVLTAVPEPSAVGLVASGLALLLGSQLRRRTRRS
jgi:hypothetical protein